MIARSSRGSEDRTLVGQVETGKQVSPELSPAVAAVKLIYCTDLIELKFGNFLGGGGEISVGG